MRLITIARDQLNTTKLNLVFAVVAVAAPVPLTLVTVKEPAAGTTTSPPTPAADVSSCTYTTLLAVTVELVTTTEDAPDAMAARPEGLLMVVAPGDALLSVAAKATLPVVVVAERSSPELKSTPSQRKYA
jgi:hypothetical protein